MNKKRKFLSVGQQMNKKEVSGIVYLLGGFFFSYKGMDKHLILASFFAIAFSVYSIFNIIQDRNCEEERFDEMATENLNNASSWVLLDFSIVGVIIMIVDLVQDTLRYFFSVGIQWEKYFTMSPFAFVLFVLGFKNLMTGLHFKRLERE